jgi:hypothetical protein
VQLIERKTGRSVEVPDDQAQAAYQSGQYGIPKGASIPVVSQDGQVGTVDGADAARAVDDGLSFATHQQVVEAKHAGVGETAIAGGLGVVRGLTVGLSDPIISAIGGDKARQYLEEQKEAHPIASTGGEVAGAILPAIASGGSSGAATAGELGVEGANVARAGVEAANVAREGVAGGRALEGVRSGVGILGAPSRAVTGLGELAERGVARIVGDGATSTIGRLAQKAITKGAGAAAEGALFNVGNQISEDTLGDHELSGEKLLAAIGHGAVLGAATGAAFGTIGELGSTLVRKAKVDELAAEQAFRAVGGSSRRAAALAEKVGGKAVVGRTVLEEGLLKFGDTIEDIAPRIAERRAQMSDKLGTMLGELDALGPELAPSAERIAGRVEKELLVPLSKVPGNATKTSAIASYLEDFKKMTGLAEGAEGKLGFKQLTSFREVLEEHPELAPVRSIVDEELARAGDAAAKARGGDFFRTYRDLGKRYERLTVAGVAAEEAAARAEQAPGVGAEVAHTAGHALFGAALGHPVAGAGALAAGIGQHLVRERSAASLAVVLDKLSGVAGVRRAAAQVDSKATESLDNFFAGKGGKARVRHFKSTSDEYEANAEAVRDAAGSPEVAASRASKVSASLSAHAPKTSASFVSAAARATNYLVNALPHSPQGPSVQPQFAKQGPSDFEKAKFNRIARTVHDPTSALADLAHGTMTKDQVDALRAVYPKTYAQLQASVMKRLAEADKPLPYAKRVQLGVLLGIPADPTLAPSFVQAMQMSFAEKPQKGAGGASSSSPRRPLKTTSASSALTTDQPEVK